MTVSGATASERTPLDDATIIMARQSLRILSTKLADPIVRSEPNLSKQPGQSLNCTSVSYKLGRSPEQKRFTDSAKIGEGATGYVYAFQDENCSRQVAVKMPKAGDAASYPEEVERFLAEATVAAELEHPNIIPVYDIDIDDDGKPFMSMRRVSGGTLKDYILSPDKGPITGENDLIQIALKVCDALSFAHSKGRIHQDIKPENIMIGQYGEVFVIDWGSSSYTGDEMALTPVYMSPQQASGQEAVPGDDIYCLGATLFHCLSGRMPTHATSIEELFDRKKKGAIDEPTAGEKAKVSAPLMAIVMKALAANPEERYGTIADLAHDLKEYQSGNMVSAYDYTFVDFALRWYARHKQPIWFSLVLILVCLGAGMALYHMKLKEIATWGKPFIVETFEDDSWRDRWVAEIGEAEVRKGRLHTTGSRSYRLFYRQKLHGSFAIEFDGQLDLETAAGDLSVVWCDDLEWEDGKIVKRRNWNYLQVGAYANSFAMIETQYGRGDYNSFRLAKGRVYRIRAEVDQNRLSLFVDGRLICQSKSVFPHTSGYIGLYGYYPGKIFDNVKLYRKGVAERVRATRIGDSYFRRKQYAAAAEEYGQVVSSHGDKGVGEEAKYKAGLCHYMNNDRPRALSIWNQLQNQEMRGLAEAWRIKELTDNNEFDDILPRVRSLAAQGKESYRLASLAWERAAAKVDSRGRTDLIPMYARFHEDVFPNEEIHDFILARMLITQGRLEEVLRRYSHIKWMQAEALYCLKRYEEILSKHSDMRDHCARSLARLRRFEELEAYTDRPARIAQGLILQGKHEEILRRFPDEKESCALALMALGRYEEVPALSRTRGIQALKFLGKMEEAPDRWPTSTAARRMSYQHLGQYPKGYQEGLEGSHVVELLFARGEFEEAYKVEGIGRWQIPKGLICQGRLEEAKAFKDQRVALARVAMLNGDYSVIEAYPDLDHLQAQLLNLTGRHQQVIDKYWWRTRESSFALLYLRQPERVLRERRNGHLGTALAHIDIALRDARDRRFDKARERLQKLTPKYVGFTDQELVLPYYIFRPMLLDQSGKALRASLRNYISDRRYVFRQELWYYARFILGEIDEAEFRSQPFKLLLEARLHLAIILKALLNKDHELAQIHLVKYQGLPVYKREHNPVIDHFIEWQIKQTAE